MSKILRYGVASLAFAAQVAGAAPLSYDEAVDGDIDQLAPPTFVLGTGANTVSGTTGVSYVPDQPLGGDYDPFRFVVQAGTMLTGFTLSWSNFTPLGGLYAEPGHVNGFATCQLRDAGNAVLEAVGSLTTDPASLCASPTLDANGSVDLFGSTLPLGDGSYGWAYSRAIQFYLGQEGAWTLDYTLTLNVAQVPLSGSLGLTALGLVALLSGASRRRRLSA